MHTNVNIDCRRNNSGNARKKKKRNGRSKTADSGNQNHGRLSSPNHESGFRNGENHGRLPSPHHDSRSLDSKNHGQLKSTRPGELSSQKNWSGRGKTNSSGWESIAEKGWVDCKGGDVCADLKNGAKSDSHSSHCKPDGEKCHGRLLSPSQCASHQKGAHVGRLLSPCQHEDRTDHQNMPVKGVVSAHPAIL